MTLSIHNLPDVPIIVDPKTGAYMNGKGPRIEFIISSNNNSLISQKCLRFDFNKGDSQFILKSIKNKSRIGPFNASINSQDRRVALDCFGTSQNDLQCSIFIGSSKAQFAQCSD
jgi:hypothetical protein